MRSEKEEIKKKFQSVKYSGVRRELRQRELPFGKGDSDPERLKGVEGERLKGKSKVVPKGSGPGDIHFRARTSARSR